MNLVVEIGNLTNDPNVRIKQGETDITIARFTLAVNRPGKDKGTDFISCVAFNKNAEFAEKYLHKGMKICVKGSIRTGSYTNKDGKKVYTTDVVAEHMEFCESKRETQETAQPAPDGFVPFPEGEQEELPF